jgi:DNA-directed RNA polymerase subunit M/transcription elongation factor TFIIS
MTCPKCGSENVIFLPIGRNLDVVLVAWECESCGHEWNTAEIVGETIEYGIL